MRTQILLVCFAHAVFRNFGASIDVSSKIEFDSDEDEEASSNNVAIDATNPSASANSSESISRTFKQPTFNWRRRSGFVRSKEPRKGRLHTSHDEISSSSQPKVIDNIYIVVNSNGSVPDVNSCKHGVCNVTVSSKPDGKGNIETEVHLSVVTNAKPIRTDDIPIIDGFRGVTENQNERPISHSMKNTRVPAHSLLYSDNIPRVQSNYRGRTFQRPRTYYSYFQDRGNVGFQGHKTRPRGRAVADDKIEPPLSKTKLSGDIKS